MKQLVMFDIRKDINGAELMPLFLELHAKELRENSPLEKTGGKNYFVNTSDTVDSEPGTNGLVLWLDIEHIPWLETYIDDMIGGIDRSPSFHFRELFRAIGRKIRKDKKPVLYYGQV